MAKDISIMDMLSSASMAAVTEDVIEKISVLDIQPNQDNFYQLCNIEQLKNSIYAMGGVQQNIIVTRLPAGERYKYKLLAGHRRTLASVELVQEGHKEFEYIPAVIKNNATTDDEEMLLLMTNSTQRELTDYEKVIQHMKLKKLIPKLKRRDNLPGKTRALEAEYMNVSETQIGIYNTIGTRLETDLMELFAKDEIGISLAYEIAKLSSADQIKLIDQYVENDRLTEDDVKALIGSKPIEGQVKVADLAESCILAAEEKVSESDTFEEPEIEYAVEADEPEADNIEVPAIEFAVEENMSESDTFVPARTEKIMFYCTTNNTDIDNAIQFIFCHGTDEAMLSELINAFRNTAVNSDIVAETVFKKYLPYETNEVKVSYERGYKIELKALGEGFTVPIYYFWQGFKREFEWKWENVSESDTSENSQMAAVEKVSESVTTENSKTAAEHIYTKQDVLTELATQEGYLRRSDKDKFPRAYKRFSLTIDALKLLLDTME